MDSAGHRTVKESCAQDQRAAFDGIRAGCDKLLMCEAGTSQADLMLLNGFECQRLHVL